MHNTERGPIHNKGYTVPIYLDTRGPMDAQLDIVTATRGDTLIIPHLRESDSVVSHPEREFSAASGDYPEVANPDDPVRTDPLAYEATLLPIEPYLALERTSPEVKGEGDYTHTIDIPYGIGATEHTARAFVGGCMLYEGESGTELALIPDMPHPARQNLIDHVLNAYASRLDPADVDAFIQRLNRSSLMLTFRQGSLSLYVGDTLVNMLSVGEDGELREEIPCVSSSPSGESDDLKLAQAHVNGSLLSATYECRPYDDPSLVVTSEVAIQLDKLREVLRNWDAITAFGNHDMVRKVTSAAVTCGLVLKGKGGDPYGGILKPVPELTH